LNENYPPLLQTAVKAYIRAFGHDVPAQVLAMFASQPGPLLNEIRQAITSGCPPPAWRDLAKRQACPLNFKV
jgi:hypothetical protein